MSKAGFCITMAIVVAVTMFFLYNSVNCIHFFSTFCAVTPR